MPTNSYQVAYEHAKHELAEITAHLQRLIRRKELLEQLLEPLNLLVSESGSNTIPAYQLAFEQAISELSEINAHVEALPRRKQLLEEALDPLELLATESNLAATSVNVSDGSSSEFSDSEAPTELSAVILMDIPEVEPDPLEVQDSSTRPEVEEINLHVGNGFNVSHGDVAELAYRFWDERGRLHGYHEDDWLRAAQELQNSAY
jgi:exonuclease VII small subunit